MKTTVIISMLALGALLWADEGNPKIDYGGFVALAHGLESERSRRRVSEGEFLRMAAEQGTVILDTRSKEKFDRFHIKGAVHLNFSDFTEQSLARLIPDKTTRVLIYCNNNFEGAGSAMVTKAVPLALNIPTFINLWGYGYHNIHELKPYLDVTKTKIPFEGSDVDSGRIKLR